MKFMVPQVTCEVLVMKDFEAGGERHRAGHLAKFPYGIVLQLKAMGFAGAIVDELQKHQEAAEALRIYGADSWFPQPLQTTPKLIEYLAEANQLPTGD